MIKNIYKEPAEFPDALQNSRNLPFKIRKTWGCLLSLLLVITAITISIKQEKEMKGQGWKKTKLLLSVVDWFPWRKPKLI